MIIVFSNQFYVNLVMRIIGAVIEYTATGH